MEETEVQQILDLERRKLATQIAATEMWMDDKAKASEGRIVDAVSGAILSAVLQLKIDIKRLEHKLDSHLN
ncbi:hypothetical protein AB0F17_46525 [Nonomuraea sp. NPDC026600]|uniref:hypothetical protein n=1 Tax=Nonomuraea sp. NPDC026600 TaxID=3155363 RepID=UPI003408E4CE